MGSALLLVLGGALGLLLGLGARRLQRWVQGLRGESDVDRAADWMQRPARRLCGADWHDPVGDRRSTPCGNPATCVGEWGGGDWMYLCDDHCRHQPHDGHCFPVGLVRRRPWWQVVRDAWRAAALLLVLLPSLAHAAPDIGTTPGQDWAGAVGLGLSVFVLFGGGRWLWGKLRHTLPEVPPLPPPARSPSDHLPTAAELVAICQQPGLTLQDVCMVVWPGLPWAEAVEPWWIFPKAGYPRSERGRQRWAPDPEWPEATQRLAPAMWLYDRLQEARREGWISYTPYPAANAAKSRL